MPEVLYDTDTLAWAETQADLLRRLAGGERVNEQIDWSNVIEEVQDVGSSQMRSCESLLIQGLLHLLKLYAWPASRSGGHWNEEADTFLHDAGRYFSPSMRQRIDLADLYREALRRARRKADDSGSPRLMLDVCPFTLDELLTGDVDSLLVKLENASGPL